MLRLAAAVAAAAAAGPSTAEAEAEGLAAPVEDDGAYAAAVELLLKARAELEVRSGRLRRFAVLLGAHFCSLLQPLLDVVTHLQSDAAVKLAETARLPPRVAALTADLGARFAGKRAAAAAAAAALRRAAAAAQAAVRRSGLFYEELGALRGAARLLPGPPVPGDSLPSFLFDVGFPVLRAPPSETQVTVAATATGALRAGAGAAGADVAGAIRELRERHVTAALRRHLSDEAHVLGGADPRLGALEAALQAALGSGALVPEGPFLGAAWRRCLLSYYAEVLAWFATPEGAAVCSRGAAALPPPLRLLPRLLASLEHASRVRVAHAELGVAVVALRRFGFPQLTLGQTPTRAPLSTAWRLAAPGLPDVAVTATGDAVTVTVAGAREAAPQGWVVLWAADAVLCAALQATQAAVQGALRGRRSLRVGAAEVSGAAQQDGGVAWAVARDGGATERLDVGADAVAALVEALQ